MKIAMWSGPRNLSTALMYSFAAREDMTALDEPFYAHYLAQTGLAHPMRKDVLASQPQDAQTVAASLLAPDTTSHAYHKHMTQHMLPSVPRKWMKEVTNVFLIRHPARVLASWSNKHSELSLSDIGFTQQSDLLDTVIELGQKPIVIDSADIRSAPRDSLIALCSHIELDWDPAMLSWETGPKPYDGVWASHWYDAAHRSTSFASAEGPLPELPLDLAALNEKALPLYERLAALKISI